MRLAAEIHAAHEQLKYGIADYRRVDDKSELITTEYFSTTIKDENMLMKPSGCQR